MRKPVLTLLCLLLLTAPALVLAARATAASATYTPPAETGMIWTVINFRTAQGNQQTTTAALRWNGTSRAITVSAYGYQNPCATSSPAGFVWRIRHNTADSVPLTITTNGTIVRGPYQGEAPPELLAACYKFVK